MHADIIQENKLIDLLFDDTMHHMNTAVTTCSVQCYINHILVCCIKWETMHKLPAG